MKKVLIVVGALFVIGMTSCKKEYECCYLEDGVKLEVAGFGCITSEMKKADMEDFESTGKAAAEPLGWDFACEAL
ncbi:MAG: hypothetical protein IH948_06810 [Bacteroidetes bacterium]|nr:hypothetical protein [Bacteroidota bacterium]